MAKRLVVFNHKGGVSKTTSAYNLGWMMAKKSRILLVDADPQCNLTGLILRDDFEAYYTNEATRSQNIKDGVAPAFDGKPVPIAAAICIHPERSPKLFLLPGHANLSEYDAALTFAQTANNAIVTLQNLPGAFSQLLRLTEEKYKIDYTIIDLNPGLSAINQNFFLISNAFIIPTNPDPFSLMALNTLKTVLPRWVSWKKDAAVFFADSAYPLPPSTPKFIGTLVQRFNIRNGRAAKPYRENIDEINDAVANSLLKIFGNFGMLLKTSEYGSDLIQKEYCLSQIPDFQGLLPKAHDAGVPIFDITDGEINETGPVFDQLVAKRKLFRKQFRDLAAEVTSLLDYA